MTKKTKKKAAPKGRWVLFGTHAAMEDDTWYGLALIEPERIDAAVAGMARLHAEGIDATALDFNSWTVWWFTAEDLEEMELRELPLDIETFAVLSDAVGEKLSEGAGQRTECDAAVLCYASYSGSEPTLYWECYPKHSDSKIETAYCTWRDLRAAVLGEPARKAV